MIINGMQCVASANLVDTKTYQRRNNKCKRINKKWLKLYGVRHVTIPKKTVFVFDGKIIGHPATLMAMKNKIDGVTE